MDLTHQQIDELLDRIRQDTGQAIDPARITDLLEQEDRLAEAESSAELSQLEADAAQRDYNDARERHEAASSRWSDDEQAANLARGRLVMMRRNLGILRTATGYITIEQGLEARGMAAAAAEAANSFQRDQAALAAKAADPNRTDWTRAYDETCSVCGSAEHNSQFHADPVTGLISGPVTP